MQSGLNSKDGNHVKQKGADIPSSTHISLPYTFIFRHSHIAVVLAHIQAESSFITGPVAGKVTLWSSCRLRVQEKAWFVMDRLGVALREWVKADPLTDGQQMHCRSELKVGRTPFLSFGT